jgi:hypothetical protein
MMAVSVTRPTVLPRTDVRRGGWPRTGAGHRTRAHALDQPLHPLVDGTERVLAEHGALGLVVQLEVHPVDGEVAASLLGTTHEVAAQLGAGGLRWYGGRLEHLDVGGDPFGQPAPAHQVVQPAVAVDVVVGQVEPGHPG